MPLFATYMGAGFGAVVGAAAVYGYMSSRPKVTAAPGPTQATGHPLFKHPAARHGLPVKERIRAFSNYIAGFDPATRNPAWVLERLSKDTIHGDAKRANVFSEDTVIPARFRSKLSDYKGSGYDRGHMTPCMNHKGSQASTDETFTLSNISPQVGEGFNRDFWARLEKFTKDVVKKADEVFIVTGPIFAPIVTPNGVRSSHAHIGTPPQSVAVPTHYYKVVLAESTDARSGEKKWALGAFALPNARISPETPLASFVVPMDFLESVTGIEFFPQLLSDNRRLAVDNAALEWRRLGTAQRQALALQGSKQQFVDLPGQEAALVPAGQLPPLAELQQTGVDRGARGFRPRRVGASGQGVVHLCEEVSCQLPQERFWEGKGAGGQKK